VPVWLGIMCGGGVAVPGNIYLTAPEVAFLLSDAQPGYIVTETRFLPLVRQAMAGLPYQPALILAGGEAAGTAGCVPLNEFRRDAAELDSSSLRSGDLAEIIYTSGTSSR